MTLVELPGDLVGDGRGVHETGIARGFAGLRFRQDGNAHRQGQAVGEGDGGQGRSVRPWRGSLRGWPVEPLREPSSQPLIARDPEVRPPAPPPPPSPALAGWQGGANVGGGHRVAQATMAIATATAPNNSVA